MLISYFTDVRSYAGIWGMEVYKIIFSIRRFNV